MQQQHQGKIQRLRQQLEEDVVRENQSQQQKFTTAMDDQKRSLEMEKQREKQDLTKGFKKLQTINTRL